GNQDAGEDGINGVTVKLIDKNTGNVVDTQTTSGDGGYLFDGVSAGDYTVMVDESTLPANLVQTGDPDATLDDMSMVVNFPAGGTNLDQDFGYRELLGTIGDRVWFDTDGDGNQDAGEDGINGVTVKLIDKNTGNVVDTEVTSGDGGYLFDGVSAGDYTVMVDESTLPANLVQTGDPDATLDDMSMVVNFPAGGTNLDQDFGYQPGNPDIDIEKFVNGIDVTDINDLPEIEAGADVTFTYEVTNTGNVAFNLSDIVVVDDDGTPGNTADDFTPQLVNSSDVNGDNVLSPGETWLYKSQTVAAQDLTTATADKDVRFTLTGNSPLDGPDGNVRTFTKDGVSVDVSAFSRNSHGWQKAYLGAYGGGLGVTNKYESGSAHRIDNRGSRDYVLFEFAEDVTVDRAFLDYIGHDSDISVWIGDRNGADISHLSDSILNGFTKENNFGGRYSRWADFNSGELKGDTVVISAYTNHSNDAFKLKKLDVSVHGETEIGVYKNTVTVTADSASDSDMSGYTNPEPTQALSSLGDRVWHDTNRNGIQDSGESGVGGVTVTLTGGGNDGKIGTADDTTATATTNSNGTYGFDNLNPGEEYKLTFELPSNAFEFTSANSGGNDAKDSDVDPSTGMTQIVTLAPGENNSTLDAGIREAKVDLGIHKEVTNVTAGSRWSAIGYSDDIAYPLDIMRYDITVTNHSNVTATGIVVEDIVPENFDIAEPGQTVSDTGMGWNQNGRHFDSRVWWGRAYQGSVDVIDSTNGTVSIVDPGVAHTGLTLAPGQSYGLPEGSVTWELGDSLAPGESVTLSYFGKREVYSAYNWNTGTQFFTDASITHVDQHDSNPHNDSDSGRSWWISPITFDLNGDGIQTRSIDQGVKFDLLNTGEAVNTGWISGNDGFLAIDNNGDGVISDRSELFGGGVGDGFAKLASFDSNGDALVNEADAQFGALKLWQDANENGVTDQGELVSLASVGITDLSTDYTNVFKADAQGNIHGEVSTAVKNGNSIEMTDVYFQVAV
ncbi:MAG: SdrD B-like domain-containing protein, partial [Cyanobacteria bacterium P01_F01_bin.150]